MRSGNDFVRVATSLRKENGDRAMGTVLDTASPAYAAVTKGRLSRSGVAVRQAHITQYQPFKTQKAVSLGSFCWCGYHPLRDARKILNRRLGDSGHFFVLDRSNGKTRGQFLFHSNREGQLPEWDSATQQQLLSNTPGTLERTSEDGRIPENGLTPLPGWNWTIVGKWINRSCFQASPRCGIASCWQAWRCQSCLPRCLSSSFVAC